MLLFEFLPAFVALVGGLVAVWLFIVERRASNDPAEATPRQRPARRPPPADGAPERTGRRPSMMP